MKPGKKAFTRRADDESAGSWTAVNGFWKRMSLVQSVCLAPANTAIYQQLRRLVAEPIGLLLMGQIEAVVGSNES